jgi:hypothetical protein
LNIVKSSNSEDCVGSRSYVDDGRNGSAQSGEQEDTSTKKDNNQEETSNNNNNDNFVPPPKEEYIKPQYPTLADYSTGLNIVKSSSSTSSSTRRRYDHFGGDYGVDSRGGGECNKDEEYTATEEEMEYTTNFYKSKRDEKRAEAAATATAC